MNATLTPPTFEMDLRSVAPHQRHALIFGRFDVLATGQALQLVSDHNPQPLQYQFENRAFGEFEWATLEAGPAVWRIRITRIADAAHPPAGDASNSCCSGGACCA